ncbi:MAG: hypothetical protein AAGF92_02155 [Myxococcota bacterium]
MTRYSEEPYISRGGKEIAADAVNLLVREWPGALGNLLLMSRRHPRLLGELPEGELSILDGWEKDPIDTIYEFLFAAFRMEWDIAGPLATEVDYERALYILTYLSRSHEAAREIVRVFVPVLRPGLWEREFRLRLISAFFDIAQGLVWEADEVAPPEPGADYDWPGNLNSMNSAAREELLSYAGVSRLDDPMRPSIRPWNEGWMSFHWLWREAAARAK